MAHWMQYSGLMMWLSNSILPNRQYQHSRTVSLEPTARYYPMIKSVRDSHSAWLTWDVLEVTS